MSCLGAASFFPLREVGEMAKDKNTKGKESKGKEPKAKDTKGGKKK